MIFVFDIFQMHSFKFVVHINAYYQNFLLHTLPDLYAYSQIFFSAQTYEPLLYSTRERSQKLVKEWREWDVSN